jgi:hypothetical protein
MTTQCVRLLRPNTLLSQYYLKAKLSATAKKRTRLYMSSAIDSEPASNTSSPHGEIHYFKSNIITSQVHAPATVPLPPLPDPPESPTQGRGFDAGRYVDLMIKEEFTPQQAEAIMSLVSETIQERRVSSVHHMVQNGKKSTS